MKHAGGERSRWPLPGSPHSMTRFTKGRRGLYLHSAWKDVGWKENRALRVKSHRRTFPAQISVPDGCLSLRAPRLLAATALRSLGALSESRGSGMRRRVVALDPESPQ